MKTKKEDEVINMPVSEDKADKQKQEENFNESGVQVLSKENSKGKISPGNIITAWNSGDKEKINLMLISNTMLDRTFSFSNYYEFIALNKTKYAKPGSNKIKGLRYLADKNCSELIHDFKKGFDHVEKEPYVAIPIEHK